MSIVVCAGDTMRFVPLNIPKEGLVALKPKAGD